MWPRKHNIPEHEAYTSRFMDSEQIAHTVAIIQKLA